MISKEQFKEDLVATRSKLQALEDQGAARANTLSPELSTIYLTVTAGFLLWISPETVTLAALKSFGLYIGASSFWLCGLEFGERLAISRCRRTVQRPLDAAEGGTLQGQKADVLHGKEFRFLGAVERWLAHGCAVFEPVGWVSDWVADAFFVRVPGLFRGRAA
ncbi:hypothetical protein BDW74DRAFT_178744 [Aspergillus multicolor]|uniref:uncharacterized protein n=1 Tax=Aspergillus multicolor TaxID=41759 RepID=UPI003CCDED8B